MEAGILPLIDTPTFAKIMEVVDPASYWARLARLPKMVVLSSDDEFMQFDWSGLWWDDLPGEKLLLIPPDSEHSLATGIPEVLSTTAAFFVDLVTNVARPSLEFTRNATTGELVVTLPEGRAHGKVVLRHAQTLQSDRRDFRWVKLADNTTAPDTNCKLPGVKIPPVEGGGNCVQPIVWTGKTLSADATNPRVYRATPPAPTRAGHWVGYYVEVFFPSQLAHSEYQVNTPGFVWPDAFPHKDCEDFATCPPKLL